MTHIRVDPDKRKQASRKINAAAERLRELESEILRTAAQAPSYDGQFRPKVEQLADEGSARLRVLHLRLAELAEELEAKPNDFVQADQETLAGLNALFQRFSDLLVSFELLGTPVPPTGTPAPRPVETPVPSVTPTSEYDPAYWICVEPLVDLSADRNHVAYNAVPFGHGPFSSEPSPAPSRPADSYSADPRLIAMRGFGLIASTLRQIANYQAVENMPANVRVQLRYASYDHGYRIMGVHMDNRSAEIVVPARTTIYQFVGDPEGEHFGWDRVRWPSNTYVGSGSAEYIRLGSSAEMYPHDANLFVQVDLRSFGQDAQLRSVAWWVDGATGEATIIDPALLPND